MSDFILERAWKQAEHRVEQLMTERAQWRADRALADAELDRLRVENERLTKMVDLGNETSHRALMDRDRFRDRATEFYEEGIKLRDALRELIEALRTVEVRAHELLKGK